MQKGNKGRMQSTRKKTDYYDYNLLAAVILLICFGLIMLYSTSAYEAQLKFKGDDMYYFRRQAIISAGAILVAIFMSRFDYHLLIPISGLAFVVSLILMALVRFSPLAVTAFGSRRCAAGADFFSGAAQDDFHIIFQRHAQYVAVIIFLFSVPAARRIVFHPFHIGFQDSSPLFPYSA